MLYENQLKKAHCLLFKYNELSASEIQNTSEQEFELF